VKKLLILILLMWSVVSMRPCSLARAQEEDYSFSYWASLKGHYSPGKCTDGDDFLSEKGRLNNPKRRIRCLRIAYRGPESLDSYRSAVKRALQMAKERDQTHGMKNDNNVNGNFDLASSDLVGAGKKVILAWGDELNGNSGFVVVHKVSDGRLEVMPQDGSLLTCGGGSRKYEASYHIGSYIGEVSSTKKPKPGSSSLQVIPMGQRNKIMMVSMWNQEGDIAYSFWFKDRQH